MSAVARLLLLAVLLWVALAARAASPVSNTFLYAPCTGTIRAYRAQANGTLTTLPSLRLAAYPIDVAAHPSGKFLYAATVNDQTHKGTVWAVRVRPNGTLEPLLGSITRVKAALGQVTVHPGGKLLYVLQEEGRILVFAIRGNGSLRRLRDQQVPHTFSIGQGIGSWGGAWLRFTAGGRLAYLHRSSGLRDVYVKELQAYRVGTGGALTRWGAERRESSFVKAQPPSPPPGIVETLPRRSLAALHDSAGTWLCPVLPNGSLKFTGAWRIRTPKGQTRYSNYLSLLEADPKGRFLYLGLTDIEATRSGSDHLFYVCRLGERGQTSRPAPLLVDGVLLAALNGRYLYTARPHLKPSASEYDRYDVSVHDLRPDGTVSPARSLALALPSTWDTAWLMVERRP